MSTYFNQLLIQTGYYAIVMLLCFAIVSFLQRGYFLRFFRVKLSFGKLLMVKIRAVNRDYYRVGKIEDKFLVYKFKKQDIKRIAVKDKDVFYRSLGVTWVDTEEESNNLCRPDYTIVPGFDAIKFNNLYIRSLYRPVIADNMDKIIITAIIVAIIAIVIIWFMINIQYKEIQGLRVLIQALKVSGQVKAGGL